MRVLIVPLLLLGAPVLALPLPAKMLECEQSVGCTGDWRFLGNEGTARWTNGVEAKLIIKRFDGGGVVISRTDVSGFTLGATVNYVGTVQGNKVQGKATYKWPGHWNNRPVTVSWSATIQESAGVQPVSVSVPARSDGSNGPIGQWRNPDRRAHV